MKTIGNLEKVYNSKNNYAVRVQLEKDDFIETIEKECKKNSELNDYYQKIKKDVFVIAEKEEYRDWKIHICEYPSWTFGKELNFKDTDAIEKAVVKQYGSKYMKAFDIQSQKDTILHCMLTVKDIANSSEQFDCCFNNFNGYRTVRITYNSNTDEYSIEAERIDVGCNLSHLDYDELESILYKMSIDEQKVYQLMIHINKDFYYNGHDYQGEKDYVFETVDFERYEIYLPEDNQNYFEADCGIFKNTDNLVIIKADEKTLQHFEHNSIEETEYNEFSILKCFHQFVSNERNEKNMSEWVNYGDTNFVEEGGILLKATERLTEFEFIDVSATEDHRMLAVSGMVDIADYQDAEKKASICDTIGQDPEYFNDNNPMDYACAVVEYYGGQKLGGSPIINDSIAYDESEYKPDGFGYNPTTYMVTKQELCCYLNDVGFETKNEELDKYMSYDKRELADSIEDFMFDRGEYDYSESDRIPWLKDCKEPYELAENVELLNDDRAEAVSHIEKSLNAGGKDFALLIDYFDDQIRICSPADELREKASIFKECLENIKEKEFSKEKIVKEM